MAEQYKLSKTAAEINEKILNAAEIKIMTSAEYDLLPNPSSNTLYMLTDIDEETLTVDEVPVEGSVNPVASGGMYTALNNLQTEVDGKQNVITGTAGQFVVIGDDGNVTTKTVPNAEEASF